AHAVDQYQHALGPEVAQVHRRRAGADAAAIGREAEVAAGVELGVQRRAAGGEVLHDVGDRGEAAAVDVLAREDLDRDLAFEFGLLDAGTGDGDRVQRARLRGVGRRVLRRGKAGK